MVRVQRSLELSHAHAKEVLEKVAMRAKNGPYRGEWVLKAEYRVAQDATATAAPS